MPLSKIAKERIKELLGWVADECPEFYAEVVKGYEDSQAKLKENKEILEEEMRMERWDKPGA